MNTGNIIETKNLLLKPENNETDNEPFIRMLSQDGDFESFCGLPFSGKYLEMFVNYFEHKENEQCLYSLYIKDDDVFIGYVGFHRECDDYELEFYVGKEFRRRGFCKEACVEVINLLFDEGLSVDGNILVEEKLYATTLPNNVAVNSLLENLGFKSHAISAGGAVLVAQGVYDEEGDDFHAFPIKRYVIEKSNGSMSDLDITPERKIEIDEILKETHKKFINGEIKAIPIKEFWEERKNEELKSSYGEGDD
jgi:RimJ/RimL family protein N-acetyltransferase